jgi:hypothetical protein
LQLPASTFQPPNQPPSQPPWTQTCPNARPTTASRRTMTMNLITRPPAIVPLR